MVNIRQCAANLAEGCKGSSVLEIQAANPSANLRQSNRTNRTDKRVELTPGAQPGGGHLGHLPPRNFQNIAQQF